MARDRAPPQERHLRPIEGGLVDNDEERQVQVSSRALMAIHVASHFVFKVDKKGRIIEVVKAIGVVRPERMIGMSIFSFIVDGPGAVSAMKNLKHTMETGVHLHIRINCRRLLSDRNIIPMNFVITRDTKKTAIIYCDTPIYAN